MTALGLTPAATLVVAAICIVTAAAFGIATTLVFRLNRLEQQVDDIDHDEADTCHRLNLLIEWANHVQPEPVDTQPMGEVLATEISRPVPYVRAGGRHAKR